MRPLAVPGVVELHDELQFALRPPDPREQFGRPLRHLRGLRERVAGRREPELPAQVVRECEEPRDALLGLGRAVAGVRVALAL
ncbi:MAG: hypothetical protein FJ304_14325 [Planctomycetes bacterium]|nr:hypothetical protein [Planctomycetota bacterium]